jgi:hypothetical protein
MSCVKLIRILGLPLAALALALALTAPAQAGGGGMPTGPSVSVSPPSVALDGEGGAIVTVTLVCWDEAVAEQVHVPVSVALGQQQAAGGASIEGTCAAEPQTLALAVSSATGHAFHPGPISGTIEFMAVTSKGAGIGYGEIDQLLLPAQAAR